MMASRNTVPPSMFLIVPLGDFHIFFSLNSTQFQDMTLVSHLKGCLLEILLQAIMCNVIPVKPDTSDRCHETCVMWIPWDPSCEAMLTSRSILNGLRFYSHLIYKLLILNIYWFIYCLQWNLATCIEGELYNYAYFTSEKSILLQSSHLHLITLS